MFSGKKAIFIQHCFLVAVGTLLLCLAISGASLWIDEGITAALAVQTSLPAWAATLSSMRGSEMQMPAYVFYIWAWARVFGTSEVALRFANLPWALVFTASLAWGAEYVLKIRKAWLIFCLSPFVWFYMNEARPYAMLMSFSMLTTVSVLAYSRDSNRFRVAQWWAMISLLALWSVHMLTIVLAPSLLLFLCITRPVPFRRFIKQWFLPVVVILPFYCCLALYYVHTLVRGKGGLIESPSMANLLFAIYEFFGFGGLGPPRNLLRNFFTLHTLALYLPSLGFGVVALCIVIFSIFKNLRESSERREVIGLFGAFLTGLLITLALSYVTHFRVLGRHVATFYPLLVLILLSGLLAAGNRTRNRLGLFALLLLGVAWSISDFRLRLLPSYQKDDYRDAAVLARTALLRGEPVLWLANGDTAKYYGLPVFLAPRRGDIAQFEGMATVSRGCSPSWFQKSLPHHDEVLVVISDKPDLFDPEDNCQKALNSLSGEHVARFSDFDVWQIAGHKSVSEKY
jgi:hypothetical protein